MHRCRTATGGEPAASAVMRVCHRPFPVLADSRPPRLMRPHLPDPADGVIDKGLRSNFSSRRTAATSFERCSHRRHRFRHSTGPAPVSTAPSDSIVRGSLRKASRSVRVRERSTSAVQVCDRQMHQQVAKRCRIEDAGVVQNSGLAHLSSPCQVPEPEPTTRPAPSTD